jgi:hypothetical protein
MPKRLLIGLAKGLLLGVLVGATLHFGLGFSRGGVLLGYLVAMGSASTAGILAGKPPWKQDAGIEVVLKTAVGLGVGALFYYLSSRFAARVLPFAIPTFPTGAKWTEIPLLVAIGASSLYGAIVELDNTGAEPPAAKPNSSKAPGARPAHEIEEAELVSPQKRG